jgi:hypothetical protein
MVRMVALPARCFSAWLVCGASCCCCQKGACTHMPASARALWLGNSLCIAMVSACGASWQLEGRCANAGAN